MTGDVWYATIQTTIQHLERSGFSVLSVNNGLIVIALMGAKNMSVIFVVIKIKSMNILKQLFVLSDFFGLPNYYFFNLCVFSFNRTSNN